MPRNPAETAPKQLQGIARPCSLQLSLRSSPSMHRQWPSVYTRPLLMLPASPLSMCPSLKLNILVAIVCRHDATACYMQIASDCFGLHHGLYKTEASSRHGHCKTQTSPDQSRDKGAHGHHRVHKKIRNYIPQQNSTNTKRIIGERILSNKSAAQLDKRLNTVANDQRVCSPHRLAESCATKSTLHLILA